MKNFNLELERAVIGEILTFDNLKEKTLLIEEEDFQFKEHRAIVKAMRELKESQGEYDFIAVSAKTGGEYRTEIQACIQIAVSEALFDEHFKLLKEMASRRRLESQFNKLSFDGELSVATIRQMLDDEEHRRIFDDVLKINDKSIDLFLSELNLKKASISTGFGFMDKILGGIRKGTVFIIGARPSTGKTSFALNIAANQMKDKDKSVIFFSLEMSAEMIYERVVSSEGLIEYEKFSRNTLTDEDLSKCAKIALDIKENKRFIVVDNVYSVEQICNIIGEQKPNLAVVDFMQIVTAHDRFENQRSKIDYISALLKRTAKNTGCAIIVLSQLSRAGKEAPKMSDLKESGGLEQDGDYIALLHRPFVLDKSGEHQAERTELLLDKNKFGRTGKVDLYFNLKYQRFSETMKK